MGSLSENIGFCALQLFRATPSSIHALPVVNASDIFCGGDLVGSIEHLDV